MSKIRIIAFLMFLLLLSSSAFAEKVTIYTEELPPYNFMENGKIAGVSTEIVETVMKRAGIDYVIETNSWPVTYEKARENPNALIYSISRRVKRESLFKWIGAIVPSVQYSVFALHDRTDISINRLDDLRKYRIGTTVGDAREAYFVNKGFDLKDFQRSEGKDANMMSYKELRTGIIDLWPMPDIVAYYEVRQAGHDLFQVLRKVFELTEISQGEGYYLAASLSTPDGLVKRVSAQLAELKRSPEYKAILEKWGMRQSQSK